MPRSARRTCTAALYLLSLSASAASTSARAQEIQITGPLAGAPAAVIRRSRYAVRFELGPSVSVPIAADLHPTPLAGAHLGYRGLGRWLVGIGAAHAVQPPPTAHGSDARVGQLAWIASPEVGWVPFEGEIGTMVDTPLRGALTLAVGPSLVGLQERADCAAGCDRPLLVSHRSRMALAGAAGAGIALHPGSMASLAFDWRLVSLQRSRGVDVAGAGANGDSPDGRIDANDRQLVVDQLITLRLSVFFPDGPPAP